jgi:hypothetical protein
MTPAQTRGQVIDALWLVVVAALSSAWCLSAASHLGATFDEPFYIAKGLECRHTGSYRPLMRAGTMPLPVDVQTLPLYLWERWRGEAFQPYFSLDILLPVARAMNLPFWWLLLFYGLRLGRALGGPWAGRLACGLLAADPNLLAHAALATTDIALTATVLAATYHWHVGRESIWLRRVFVPGIWFGIALAAKASALAFVPILFGVFGLDHLRRAGQLAELSVGSVRERVKAAWAATTQLRGDMLAAGGIGLAVLFAYCGCDWQAEPTFIEWAAKLPDGPTKATMLPVSKHLKVFTNAGEGLAQQIKHNMRGHGAYLLGEWHRRACWYYFPVALAAKLPATTLVLLGFVLVTRPRALFTPAGWAAAALLLFSLNCRVQIGVRLVFPLIALLLIALATACAAGGGTRRRTGLMVGFVALLISVGVSGSVWPDGLRYTNRLWGGPEHGHEVLGDSNYDWGQGLPELRDWWRTHDEPKLFIWYYGADPAVLLPPFHLLAVHQMPQPSPSAVAESVGCGHFAVSISLLHSCPDRRPEVLAVIDWLKRQEPIGRTGTFVIYRLR